MGDTNIRKNTKATVTCLIPGALCMYTLYSDINNVVVARGREVLEVQSS